MSLTYELGKATHDKVLIRPEWTSSLGKRQNRSEHRARKGGFFNYIWGDFKKFKLPMTFVPSSSAGIINQWWEDGEKLLLFVTSGSATEVHSVQILNKSEPFQEFQKPYITLYRGVLELEGY